MRTVTTRGVRSLVLLVIVTAAASACGGTPPSASPIAVVAPIVTPDPHLPDPATANQVFQALGSAGLRLTATNAVSGAPGKEPVKRINAAYLGWPLIISQYSSSSALTRATNGWRPGDLPGQGEPPIAITGMNILVEWGPTTGAEPKVPDEKKDEALTVMIGTLDKLLSPLHARTIVPVPVAGSTPAPTATATPTPTKTPKPTKSAKPTKSPKP